MWRSSSSVHDVVSTDRQTDRQVYIAAFLLYSCFLLGPPWEDGDIQVFPPRLILLEDTEKVLCQSPRGLSSQSSYQSRSAITYFFQTVLLQPLSPSCPLTLRAETAGFSGALLVRSADAP